jgi:hypothetical protein
MGDIVHVGQRRRDKSLFHTCIVYHKPRFTQALDARGPFGVKAEGLFCQRVLDN